MSYHNDPYRVDYLKIYPCLKERPDVLEVCRRIVAPDSLFQVLILFLNGHDTTPPLLPAASSRRRDR